MKRGIERTSGLVLALVLIMLAAGAVSLWSAASRQTQQPKDPYSRPALKEQQKPTIPTADRNQSDKVFLEYADSLFRPAGGLEEFQVVKGSVKFRHGGMWMFCDSAYYYPEQNSLIAFGHVEMQQGDTLFVYADHLNYDGYSRHAVLNRGPSRDEVELRNREVRLITDSLDYDLNAEKGWYATGGKLFDDVNTLTSLYGEYSPSTKLAEFRQNVVLLNNRDGYRLTTEELFYNTSSHIADIHTTTRIEGANDTILTTRGTYNTATDEARLTARSIIMHADSTGNVTTLEGDSIIYDKMAHLSRAFMFSAPDMNPKPMVITDTARKVTLIGGYGEYNDSSRFALAAIYPLLMEYSRPDTLFLRADTILSRIETRIPHVADKIALPQSSDSVSETLNDAELFLSPDPVDMEGNDTIIGEEVEITQVDYRFPDFTAVENIKPGSAATDSTTVSLPTEYHIALAWPRARFFNRQLQGIADTLRFEERDSMLHLIRKPMVWSDQRQIYGNLIDVHFNDSTPDWALLPESGMVVEHVDENFYNQLTGKRLKAFFENNTLRHLDVDGNVQMFILPQENDSSFNKIVYAESSFMSLDMAPENKIDNLKMWPEVTGTVTPLFDVKRAEQQFLPGFVWRDDLRPKRSWYGGSLHWEDDLGEVPDALIEYFEEPELFRSSGPGAATPQSASGSNKESVGAAMKMSM